MNGFVAAGLIYLRLNRSEKWTSPFQTYLPVVGIYLFLNIFLVLAPFVPPSSDWSEDGYPYYAYPIVGVGILFLGAAYWFFWTRTGNHLATKLDVGANGERRSYDGKLFEDERPLLQGTEESLAGRGNGSRHGYTTIDG